MNSSEINATSANKILEAATVLFSRNSFDSVSVKEISAASGVNSALISYYFGGKKNLYQEVLYTQSEVYLKLQEKIKKLDVSPLSKLRSFVEALADAQSEHPYQIHLVYREFLSPEPMFENYIKNRLYLVHQFMADLVREAIDCGEIKTAIQPTHVAFTLEGIIMFFFLAKSHVRTLGDFEQGQENEYLFQALNTYLTSLSR